MNVYEMEGFLRGKCLPGDLLVGESHAAYLVRKLNESATLKAERDASLNAERVWETSMMAVCGEDGPASVSAFIKALAVENAALKNGLEWLYAVVSSDAVSIPDEKYSSVTNEAAVLSETPATSAALAAIEARGVENAAVKMQESGAQTFGDCYIALVQYANELREAK